MVRGAGLQLTRCRMQPGISSAAGGRIWIDFSTKGDLNAEGVKAGDKGVDGSINKPDAVATGTPERLNQRRKDTGLRSQVRDASLNLGLKSSFETRRFWRLLPRQRATSAASQIPNLTYCT